MYNIWRINYLASGSAPAFNNSCTSSRLLSEQATWRGVKPLSSGTLTSGLASLVLYVHIKILITFTCVTVQLKLKHQFFINITVTTVCPHLHHCRYRTHMYLLHDTILVQRCQCAIICHNGHRYMASYTVQIQFVIFFWRKPYKKLTNFVHNDKSPGRVNIQQNHRPPLVPKTQMSAWQLCPHQLHIAV